MSSEDVFHEVLEATKKREKANKELKLLNEFLREVGKPDETSEKIEQQAGFEIRRFMVALKKRNVK